MAGVLIVAAYSLPDFNLTMNVWDNTQVVTDPPKESGVACSLSHLAKGNNLSITLPAFNYYPYLLVKTPLHVDPGYPWTILEIPAGSGNYYNSIQIAPVYVGHPNEHLAVWVIPIDSVGNRLFQRFNP